MPASDPQQQQFTAFSDAFPQVSALLDPVRDAFPQGNVVVGTAYSVQRGKASDAVSQVTSMLTSDQVGYFSGLGFTNPSSLDDSRTDVTNSALAAWDKAAGKYLHGQTSDGDQARADMQARYAEFDAAVQSQGTQAVTPDT